jgi:hypothetical protein
VFVNIFFLHKRANLENTAGDPTVNTGETTSAGTKILMQTKSGIEKEKIH